MTTNTDQNEAAQASCAPAAGYALNREQREILDHTRHRAAGGHYCGGGKEMDALVAMGLMESHGSFLGNPYFGITAEGVKALRAHTDSSSAMGGEKP